MIKKILPVGICLMFIVLVMPNLSLAATKKPSCTLTVSVDNVDTKIRSGDINYLRAGSVVRVGWTSRNATKATDGHGKTVPVQGEATSTIEHNQTLSYRFNRGSTRTACTVSFRVVSGTVVQKRDTKAPFSLQFLGKVHGLSSVSLFVYPQGTTTPIYTSPTIRLRNSGWSHTIPKPLTDGVYQVVLVGARSGTRLVLATTTLLVGASTTGSRGASTVVVVPVPLLIGGVGHSGASVAVAYLQVINIGTSAAQLHGFTLNQTGTTPVEAIVGMTAVTDNGVARGSSGTMSSGTPFVGNGVFVPLETTLAPSEMRLVTIKAVLAPNLTPYLATKTTLYVTGISTDTKSKGDFPLYGTTWTIGL